MGNKMGLDQATMQNLTDAGCNDAFIEQFAHIAITDHKAMIDLLNQHRAMLLDEYHISQKRIDRLDYLIYKITKSNERG